MFIVLRSLVAKDQDGESPSVWTTIPMGVAYTDDVALQSAEKLAEACCEPGEEPVLGTFEPEFAELSCPAYVTEHHDCLYYHWVCPSMSTPGGIPKKYARGK